MSASDLAAFATGSVVRLMGQRVNMTVIGGGVRNEHVDVCWFDCNNEMRSTTAPIAALEPVPADAYAWARPVYKSTFEGPV